jgi:FAD/FMN-containing dehydrogenase
MVDAARLVNELAGIVGQDHAGSEEAKIAQFTIDGVKPRAVVYPKDARQVSEVIEYANRNKLSVVPWGSGSKISAGNPPKRLDLVLCTRRMNHMKDVDVSNLTLTAEAGVKFADIQARLATEDDRCYLPLEGLTGAGNETICSDRSRSGCFLPIDAPYSSKATIGGIIAANSSGPRRLLYNLPRDLILGIRFVAPNGDIIGSGGKTVKNVSGYDVSKLMVGSCGTLGILCDMTLRLLPLPEAMETLLFSFGALSDASEFAGRILETPLLPAAVEVMSGNAFGHLEIKPVSGYQSGRFVVAVALEAFKEAVERMRIETTEMAAKMKASSQALLPEESHGPFWLAVSEINSTLSEKYPGLLTLRLNYPVSEWKGIAEFVTAAMDQGGLEHTLSVHAGSGVCLVNLLYGAGSRKKAILSVRKMLERCRKSDGNLVVQRAPAEIKPDLPIWGEAGSDFAVMKMIKGKLDPNGIMSPGRYVNGI